MTDRPWDLMRRKESQRALERMLEAYAERKNASNAMELGVAYLFVADYQAAWEHFHNVILTDRLSTAIFYGMAGTAKWCLNEPDEAISIWRDGLDTYFADSAGGVKVPLLLFFASIATSGLIERGEAERLLLKRAKDPRLKNWPGPLVEYVLGRIDEKTLRERCIDRKNHITMLWNWQADFYLGALEYGHGNTTRFLELMRRTGTVVDEDLDSTKQQYLGKLWREELFIARHEAKKERVWGGKGRGGGEEKEWERGQAYRSKPDSFYSDDL